MTGCLDKTYGCGMEMSFLSKSLLNTSISSRRFKSAQKWLGYIFRNYEYCENDRPERRKTSRANKTVPQNNLVEKQEWRYRDDGFAEALLDIARTSSGKQLRKTKSCQNLFEKHEKSIINCDKPFSWYPELMVYYELLEEPANVAATNRQPTNIDEARVIMNPDENPPIDEFYPYEQGVLEEPMYAAYGMEAQVDYQADVIMFPCIAPTVFVEVTVYPDGTRTVSTQMVPNTDIHSNEMNNIEGACNVPVAYNHEPPVVTMTELGEMNATHVFQVGGTDVLSLVLMNVMAPQQPFLKYDPNNNESQYNHDPQQIQNDPSIRSAHISLAVFDYEMTARVASDVVCNWHLKDAETALIFLHKENQRRYSAYLCKYCLKAFYIWTSRGNNEVYEQMSRLLRNHFPYTVIQYEAFRKAFANGSSIVHSLIENFENCQEGIYLEQFFQSIPPTRLFADVLKHRAESNKLDVLNRIRENVLHLKSYLPLHEYYKYFMTTLPSIVYVCCKHPYDVIQLNIIVIDDFGFYYSLPFCYQCMLEEEYNEREISVELQAALLKYYRTADDGLLREVFNGPMKPEPVARVRRNSI
ncbi:unnamed protein product [Caenorhabditis bovis]|uniref:Uncharacterized protein n=1 Tax=Caenorhabditis bovis TaxID=2654633 RepID=A0A8S1F999_9PELO|nr:unnamed protein product [Caenorhabditis bovis]